MKQKSTWQSSQGAEKSVLSDCRYFFLIPFQLTVLQTARDFLQGFTSEMLFNSAIVEIQILFTARMLPFERQICNLEFVGKTYFFNLTTFLLKTVKFSYKF